MQEYSVDYNQPWKEILFFFPIFEFQETLLLNKGKVCFNCHTNVAEFNFFLKSFHVLRE